MSLYTQLREIINRGSAFRLQQGRKMREIARVLSTEIEIAKVSGPSQDPIDLYGSALQYGTVTWLSGLDFLVSDCGYIIDGKSYFSEETTITLSTADVTNPRIDVIYVDTNGLVGKIDGTAAADPAKPEVDQETQMELTFVTVAAGASTPDDVTAGVIYAEAAGDPGEWDATENTSTVRIDLDSTNDAYAGTKAIEFASALTGDLVTLTAGAGSAISVANMDSLEMHIKPSDMARARFQVAWYEGANRISNWVRVQHGNYGLDATDVNSYQTVTIPKADFQLTAGTPNILKISVTAKHGTLSAFIDQIRTQGGGGTVIINSYVGLTEDELINTSRTFNKQQAMGVGTLTDGATITWDLDSDPIATVTIDGNRTINFINAKLGGTYMLQVVQDATTGSRTVTWDADIEWPAATAPTLSTGVDDVDVFSFVCMSADTLRGNTAGLDFA